MTLSKLATLTATGLMLSGCLGPAGDYEVFNVEVVGNQFIAEGVIDGSTPEVLQDAISDNPGVKELILKWVPGSADDESNLQASRMVRNAGITTIVPEGGIVASGGTDLFLAGAERIVGPGACVGVHSWAFQTLLSSEVTQGRDVPRDSEQHTPYLTYYDEMGIDRDFYWYTLEVADAEGMHWMSNAEISQYSMATAPLSDVEVDPQRCEEEA